MRMMAAVVELIRVVHTDVVVVLAASSLGLVTIQGLGVSACGWPLHAIDDGRDVEDSRCHETALLSFVSSEAR